MKTFKIADFIGQVLLIGGCLTYTYAIRGYDQVMGFHSGLPISYVLVGTWQIISLIVHFFVPDEYKVGLRRIYSLLFLITAILFLISMIDTVFFFTVLFGLFYWSPVLAILYLVTCLLELRKLNTVIS